MQYFTRIVSIVVLLVLVTFGVVASCAADSGLRCRQHRVRLIRWYQTRCMNRHDAPVSLDVQLVDVEWSERIVGETQWQALQQKGVIWHDFIPWEYRWTPIFDTTQRLPIAQIDVLFRESPDVEWAEIATSRCQSFAVGRLPENKSRTEFWLMLRVRLADGSVIYGAK